MQNAEYPSIIQTELGFFEKRKFKKFYNNFIGNSDFAITIGDSNGNISEVLLQLGALVLVVEPLPENFEYAEKKLKSYPQTILLHEDIGAFNAQFTYNEAYEKNILPYSSNLTVAANQSVVKIRTIDELIREYGLPAFIKINANGFENEVLKGLNSPILLVSVSFYSYLHHKTTENIRRFMAIGDYEFNWILNEEAKFQSKEWLSAKELNTSMSDFTQARFSGEIFARLKVKGDLSI